jgi:peptide chain release factor 2
VWTSSGGFFDVPAGREELNRIEAHASSPDFWSDQEAAQKLLQDRSRLEKKIERQEDFESKIADAEVLFEFAEEDESSLKELQPLLESLEHDLSPAETEMLLAGENELRKAIW